LISEKCVGDVRTGWQLRFHAVTGGVGFLANRYIHQLRFVPRNATALVTLFVCALSVSGAIFLILEMYSPFRGLMQISSVPFRNARTSWPVA
jgi:hypothetical protein